jgi:asparagine synthase (glutamine-hydrolysing)
MCGLFGILQHKATAEPARSLLQETARRLLHRGPDGRGIHAEAGVGLVHTRLSLVDLDERSNQPFWDASRRYCLLYNGELYDYADLRAELERAGVVFRTSSDTEVLLEALIHLGIEPTVSRIDGMFAFALFDAQEKSLVLARDRFGIKPLYIHDSEAAFAFASTVDAMRPWLHLQPDALTVSSYLQGFNGPMSGRSFYDGVSILPPGAIVRVKPGCRARFAQPLRLSDLFDPLAVDELAGRSRNDLVDEVEQLLLRSVESQLKADVPVGAFCSGGVDSSLLMAMAARFHSDLRVFHADIVGPLSERRAAERLSKHLKLDLKAVAVRDEHFVQTLPDVVEHVGFPVVNPTSVPLLMVSRLVRENRIKAVICGEGSDECYLGYPWLAPDVRATIRNLPRRIYRKVRGTRSPLDRLSRDRDLATALSSRFEIALGPVPFGETPDAPAPGLTATRSLASSGELSYILRTLLHRNDAMGMAASIEARFPFLDGRLAKFSVNLPHDCKVRFSPFVFDKAHLFFRDKWIIRQVADRYLPTDLSQRPKGMFPTNAFERFQVADGFFGNSAVADWFGLSAPRLRHLTGSAGPALKLRLLNLEAWMHLCIHSLPKEKLLANLVRHVSVAPV